MNSEGKGLIMVMCFRSLKRRALQCWKKWTSDQCLDRNDIIKQRLITAVKNILPDFSPHSSDEEDYEDELPMCLYKMNLSSE